MGTCEYKNLGALGHLCSGCGSSGVSEGRVPGRGCLPPQGTRSLPSPSPSQVLGGWFACAPSDLELSQVSAAGQPLLALPEHREALRAGSSLEQVPSAFSFHGEEA